MHCAVSAFSPVVVTEVHRQFLLNKDVALIHHISIGNAILLLTTAWETAIDYDRVIIFIIFYLQDQLYSQNQV